MIKAGKKIVVHFLRVSGRRGGGGGRNRLPFCSENSVVAYIFTVAFYIAVTCISCIFVVRTV